MNRQDYINLPLREYNRLPIFETNVMDTLDDISVMRAMIAGLRKYADYLESVTKERETEIWDKMECHEASKHFEDYMNVPFPDVYESREPDDLNDEHYPYSEENNG